MLGDRVAFLRGFLDMNEPTSSRGGAPRSLSLSPGASDGKIPSMDTRRL